MAKIKLWYKQDGICMYSGNKISPKDIIKNTFKYEIDHIIPISISFDDSQSNKVLVESGQNRKKSNMTPYHYLNSGISGGWSYEMYKSYVTELYKKKLINEKHKDNYLNTKDITKHDVIKGFISRNLNDTRYTSRVILNELTKFFRDKDTKVKVINGSITNQFRKNLLLKKDRDEDFRHHAQDAMICCFALISLLKYQQDYIDIETGEILSKDELLSLDKRDRQKYLNLAEYDTKIKMISFHENITMSYKIDTKVNRAISNQTIYGTRKYDNQEYVINSLDIYNDKDYERFKKKYKKDASSFLMHKHDPQTWEKLMKVIEQYPESKNPFDSYKKEFGPITKYAKKDNGPSVSKLKYTDTKLGKYIDISHNYGCKNKVVLQSLSPYRADLYYNANKSSYILVPIAYNDFKFEKGVYILPMDRYTQLLRKEGVLKIDANFDDIQESGYEFIYSFYKNNIIELVKEDKSEIHRFLSKNHNAKNYFEIKGITGKFEKQTFIGISKDVRKVYKYNVDILGNMYKIEKEKLKLSFSLDNKMIK